MFVAAHESLGTGLSYLPREMYCYSRHVSDWKSFCFEVIRSRQVMHIGPHYCDGSGPFGNSLCVIESFQNKRR